MKSFLSIVFLDSQRILEKYFHNGILTDNQLQNYLFVEAHGKDPYKPDYIFKNVMESFTKDKSTNELLLSTLDELGKMLHFRDDKIYVENMQFERWQNTILSISPLLIISHTIYQKRKKSSTFKREDFIKSIFSKSTLPSIYEPQLDYMIDNQGLNEMHMHLNGATEPDMVWHDALHQPHKFYLFIQKSLQESTVTEQYLQLGDIEQEDLFRLLKIAAQIRDKMLSIIYNNHSNENPSFTKDSFDMDKPLDYASRKHPLSLIEKDKFNSDIQYESLFFIKSFEYLESEDSIYFGYLFHYYLLIYSYFQTLLVQQETQVGFDQFQKITVNELRELTEEHYEDRYHQLQGMYNNSLSVLEGRFAPKDNLLKSYKLLKAIYKDYNEDLKKEFTLKLVPHFIKLPDTRVTSNIITFRDLNLRLKNKNTLNVLLETMKYQDKDNNYIYKNLIVGFDAAANELHASPEAFSPIFRKLQSLGYKNFTYHAGEDFVHILSGIRMIYEAIEFLDMKPGNRIGHATAIGIEPFLWKQKLSNTKLTIKKGEWLDNLVFVYACWSNNKKSYTNLAKLESKIQCYFSQIYCSTKCYTIDEIIAAWKCRKYDPFIAFKWREPGIFDDFESNELQLIEGIAPNVFEIFEAYHTAEVIAEHNKMIQIEPLEIFNVDAIRSIQNIMINFLNNKEIAIETLPTSNVRISYYDNYQDHHLLRWLGLSDKDDPVPIVVVGSDDTGIFMTNLRNEYAHIFQMINEKKYGQTAMQKIKILNRDSKSFTFS